MSKILHGKFIMTPDKTNTEMPWHQRVAIVKEVQMDNGISNSSLVLSKLRMFTEKCRMEGDDCPPSIKKPPCSKAHKTVKIQEGGLQILHSQ